MPGFTAVPVLAIAITLVAWDPVLPWVTLSPGSGGTLAAQDRNVVLSAEAAESLLGKEPFSVMEIREIRPGGRSRLAGLVFPDSTTAWVKWAPAPRGGRSDNAEPRYELAAYRLQKLFLDEPEYVVPPTVARVVPMAEYPGGGRGVRPHFSDGGSGSVLVVLQLWLQDVTAGGVWDERRVQDDSVYARHVANANILTYLIRHGDSNTGNLLISRDSANPRVFCVDNGIAFSAAPNREAHDWMYLRVRRVPRLTVERLRAIRPEDLDRLGVVIQLERRDGELFMMDAGRNLAPRRPVRISGDTIQIGLTEHEISGVKRRLQRLLNDVDQGRIETF